MIRISIRDTSALKSISYNGSTGFIDPRGRYYEVRPNAHYGDYHGMWVVENWESLRKMGVSMPDADDFPTNTKNFPKDLLKFGADFVRNILVHDNWIAVIDPWQLVVHDIDEQQNQILNFFLANGYKYSDDDIVEVIELDSNTREYTIAEFKEDGL